MESPNSKLKKKGSILAGKDHRRPAKGTSSRARKRGCRGLKSRCMRWKGQAEKRKGWAARKTTSRLYRKGGGRLSDSIIRRKTAVHRGKGERLHPVERRLKSGGAYLQRKYLGVRKKADEGRN